jgi:hypothetical protein
MDYMVPLHFIDFISWGILDNGPLFCITLWLAASAFGCNSKSSFTVEWIGPIWALSVGVWVEKFEGVSKSAVTYVLFICSGRHLPSARQQCVFEYPKQRATVSVGSVLKWRARPQCLRSKSCLCLADEPQCIQNSVSVLRTACVWLYDSWTNWAVVDYCCYEIEELFSFSVSQPARMPVSSTISQSGTTTRVVVDYYSAYFSFSSGRAIWLACQLESSMPRSTKVAGNYFFKSIPMQYFVVKN